MYNQHLELELSTQRMIYENYPELTFKIFGKYEKKAGIGNSCLEQYVVFENISSEEYISLKEYLLTNGGLLDIPLLKIRNRLYILLRYGLRIS